MKILFISAPGKNLYGGDRSLLDIVFRLKNLGHEVRVFCPFRWNFSMQLETKEIQVYYTKYYRCTASIVSVYFFSNFFRWCIYFLYHRNNSIKRMDMILWNWKPDIVYSNCHSIDIWFYLSKHLQVPHVWHIREFGWDDFQKVYFWWKQKLHKMMNQSELVIYISQSICNYYKNFIPSAFSLTLLNPISDLPRTKRKINFHGQNCHFLVPWQMAKNKQQILALKAFRTLSKKYPHARMTFLGWGEYIIILKLYCAFYCMKNVHFVWYQKNIEPYFLSADAVIVCSKKEALGRVTLEAMMYGIPIIGNHSGWTQELIWNDRGITFDGTSQDLYRKMEFLIKNEKLAQIYSDNSIDYINSWFIKKYYIKKLESVLEKLTNKTV